MKKAYILVGVPGSGKTTYAKHLGLTVFSSDMIRLDLFGSLLTNHTAEDNKRVFDILYERMFAHKGELIFDATNISRKYRIPLYNKLKSLGFEVEIDLLLEPLWFCLKQNKQRSADRIVPDDIIENYYKILDAPRINVDCDSFKIISQHTFLNDNASFETFLSDAGSIGIFKTLKKHVSKAYLPDFIHLNKNHETPYHLEDIDAHIDMCIQNSKTTPLKIISVLHDLGKSVAKNGGHYKGHENISTIYALRFFDEIKDLPPQISPADIIEVIKQHMLAHRGISEDVISINQINPALLKLIYDFKPVDETSRLIDLKMLHKMKKKII